ncbi:NAD(P)-dependent alcohol dehydrogenase [Flavilitoribacter nigricans]|uniref:NAD(P)-dependent alcohol dehydrogenase n=1 Tax=Flavilitoribacter nigricans (strain ATCC 23147 / DSM 23189 / NBRC 102662 / NCIMB 1420 / SS-2) TaxID=1122177 RepID=A0A2D0NBZ1_FLAN2|nr:NAD(P)-dependent alcohol dehydrogenase [Flavilitoribacter nigricans]PHN06007.1 NAD(P)-dependent alcohol dehydrogenase [Flavilitoribacter nigricans DSM 23189 = NBRC 102662]
MHAILHPRYGSPDVLIYQEVARPVPKENEVLIRVHAATVNRTDCGILRAEPFVLRLITGLSRPKLLATGTDFAGEIEAVGAGVKDFAVGDRVFGFDDSGLNSHAEYLTFPADKGIGLMPENTSYEDAVACLEGAHYARNFINKIDLRPENKVLVNGASGAIGSAALQMVKSRGAYATAVCNTKNVELMRSLGADRVIDYEQEDFTRDPEQYHFVFDAVGKSSFNRCKPVLLPGGTYISSELGWMAQNIFYALSTPVLGGKKVIFPVPSDIQATIREVRSLTEAGKFKPVIDRTYPLEATAEAFRYVESGQKTGNVVLRI